MKFICKADFRNRCHKVSSPEIKRANKQRTLRLLSMSHKSLQAEVFCNLILKSRVLLFQKLSSEQTVKPSLAPSCSWRDESGAVFKWPWCCLSPLRESEVCLCFLPPANNLHSTNLRRCVSALFVKLTHSSGHTPVCICNILCSQTHTTPSSPCSHRRFSSFHPLQFISGREHTSVCQRCVFLQCSSSRMKRFVPRFCHPVSRYLKSCRAARVSPISRSSLISETSLGIKEGFLLFKVR